MTFQGTNIKLNQKQLKEEKNSPFYAMFAVFYQTSKVIKFFDKITIERSFHIVFDGKDSEDDT